MSHLTIAVAIYCAYLIGSISSAILVCKIMGLPDPRTQGSRNPGATNVLRIGGKKAAAITLLGDLLKGLLPVAFAKGYGFHPDAVALIALAAFLGHLFPIYYRFEGGKGVATLLGCLIALSLPSALCWMSIWLIMAILFRYSSLAALTATLFAPIYIWFLSHQLSNALVLGVMGLLVFIRHRKNIQQLFAGTERKIGQRST